MMKQHHLTRMEAETLARKYQYLEGQKLIDGEDWPIHCVAVAPADRLNQGLFAHIYMDTRNADESLLFYKKDIFDVILISICNPLAERVAFLRLDE